MPTHRPTFPHHRLDAYRVALELLREVAALCGEIPRGYRNIADHTFRAAQNTVLLLAEGANRRGAALKRQRFVESRGECGEVAAGLEQAMTLKLVDEARAEGALVLAGRVGAMLTGLVRRWS